MRKPFVAKSFNFLFVIVTKLVLLGLLFPIPMTNRKLKLFNLSRIVIINFYNVEYKNSSNVFSMFADES